MSIGRKLLGAAVAIAALAILASQVGRPIVAYAQTQAQTLFCVLQGNGSCINVGVSYPLPVVQAPSSVSTVAASTAVSGSASSGLVIKAAPGNLYSVYLQPALGVSGYLMTFNSATISGSGATTAGTASGNMQDCVYYPPISGASTPNGDAPPALTFNPPEYFSVGIVALFSSTGCSTATVSANAFIHGAYQ